MKIAYKKISSNNNNKTPRTPLLTRPTWTLTCAGRLPVWPPYTCNTTVARTRPRPQPPTARFMWRHLVDKLTAAFWPWCFASGYLRQVRFSPALQQCWHRLLIVAYEVDFFLAVILTRREDKLRDLQITRSARGECTLRSEHRASCPRLLDHLLLFIWGRSRNGIVRNSKE